MKKLILIILFLFIQKVNAQTWVTIPDANFASYLQSTIPSAMNGNSLNITSSVVTTYTYFSVTGQGISSLSGIQYFTSLIFLDCSFNSLVSIPPLATSLQTLACNGNLLTSLPALPNSVKSIACNSNSLAVLPLLPSSLIYLTCTSNLLISLPSLPNSLQYLLCSGNSLTSLPTLPSSLKTLWCGLNNITCFPTFPNSLSNAIIDPNNFDCLPNYVLPAMNNYTTTPLCVAGNTNGCIVSGVEEIIANNNQLKLYPNPVSDILNLEFEKMTTNENLQLQIINNIGLLIREEEMTIKSQVVTINTKDLQSGIYYLKLKCNNSFYLSKRFMVAN